jgi:hypothetical protein
MISQSITLILEGEVCSIYARLVDIVGSGASLCMSLKAVFVRDSRLHYMYLMSHLMCTWTLDTVISLICSWTFVKKAMYYRAHECFVVFHPNPRVHLNSFLFFFVYSGPWKPPVPHQNTIACNKNGLVGNNPPFQLKKRSKWAFDFAIENIPPLRALSLAASLLLRAYTTWPKGSRQGSISNGTVKYSWHFF